jgi:hypothetical protein
MDASSWITDMAATKPGNVPAVDGILPDTCSVAMCDGRVPEGRGLRSDSLLMLHEFVVVADVLDRLHG